MTKPKPKRTPAREAEIAAEIEAERIAREEQILTTFQEPISVQELFDAVERAAINPRRLWIRLGWILSTPSTPEKDCIELYIPALPKGEKK